MSEDDEEIGFGRRTKPIEMLSKKVLKEYAKDKGESHGGGGGASSDESSGDSGSGGEEGGGSWGDSECFPRGTLITTPFGQRDIAILTRGEYVSSFDARTGGIVSRRILRIQKHSCCKLWRIRFQDGRQIRTTAVHSFYANRRWVRASFIAPGDEVSFVGSEGIEREKRVSESRLTHEVEDVYNLIVEGDFNFVAEGALVHSFTRFRSVRTLLWRIVLPSVRHANRIPAISTA